MRLVRTSLGGADVLSAAERVDDRPVDQREAVGGDEPRQSFGGAGAMMVGLDGGVQAEGGAAAGGQHRLDGEAQRAAQLVDVVRRA